MLFWYGSFGLALWVPPYIYIYIDIYMYTYTHRHAVANARTYTCICMYACMYRHICIYTTGNQTSPPRLCARRLLRASCAPAPGHWAPEGGAYVVSGWAIGFRIQCTGSQLEGLGFFIQGVVFSAFERCKVVALVALVRTLALSPIIFIKTARRRCSRVHTQRGQKGTLYVFVLQRSRGAFAV